jgi:3',5'-cyclic AMP phosphodiesterase CpdA
MTERKPKDAFLHVADLHFWRIVRNPLQLLNKRFIGNMNVALKRRREFAMERADAFADKLADLDISTVVFTGDFTSTSTPEEYRLAKRFVDDLAERGLRIALMPGNHDVYTRRSLTSGRFEAAFADYIPKYGYPHHDALPGGTPLILIPTVTPNLLSSKGRITQEEVHEVWDMLKESPGPVVAAGHYPVLKETAGYAIKRNRRLRNAGHLRRALGECGKELLYVSGHTHSFDCMRDEKYPHITHLTTGAFFRKDIENEVEGEFCEVYVYDDGFEVYRHTHSGEWKRIAVTVGAAQEPPPGATA